MIESLSIVFPLYNESQRLLYTIKDIERFSKKKIIKNIEYIFVDDGSTDNSAQIIKKFFKKKKSLRYKFISIKKNLGKGNALKKGISLAKNKWILTLDTDISVSLLQLNNWINKKYIKKNVFIYFGSRNLKKSKIKFKIYRKILGIIFSFILKTFFQLDIKDTQCGFKLYKNKTAKLLFKHVKDKGFVHDVEVALLARKYNYFLKELPVEWIHRDDSKLNILTDTFKMFYNLIKIKKNFI